MSLLRIVWTATLAASGAMAAVTCDFRDGAAPSNASFYVLCENATLLESHDAGRNWTSYTTGKERPLLAMAFLDANRGLIAGDNGVILGTDDGGKRWQPRTSGVTKALRAIAVVGDSVWIAGDGGVILHSSDAGRSWMAQSSPITLGLEAIYFADAQHGWAVGWIGSILRTVNGGAKWEQVQTQAAAWSLSSVYFRDANNGWTVGFDGQILASHDGGATWEKQTSPSQSWFTSIRFDQSGQGWITTREGFLTTNDGGKTWQPYAAPDGSFPNRLVSVGGKLWAIGSAGVLRRGDPDQKWSVVGGLISESAALGKGGTGATAPGK